MITKYQTYLRKNIKTLKLTEDDYRSIEEQCQKVDISDGFLQKINTRLLTDNDKNTLRCICKYGDIVNKLNYLADDEILDGFDIEKLNQELVTILTKMEKKVLLNRPRVAIVYPYRDSMFFDCGNGRLFRALETHFPNHPVLKSYIINIDGRYMYLLSVCQPNYVICNGGCENFHKLR